MTTEGRVDREPKSIRRAREGVRTADDLIGVLSDLMADVLSGEVSPQVGNAVSRDAGKVVDRVLESRSLSSKRE